MRGRLAGRTGTAALALVAIVGLSLAIRSGVPAARAADDPSQRLPCPLGSIAPPESDTPVWEDDPVVAPKKKAWEDALGGQEAARPAVQARLKGWPTTGLVAGATLPSEDRALLERLARDTWRGLDAFTDRENGLPIDHVRLAAAADGPPAGIVGDYTNVTNVGLHLIVLVAAAELGFLSPADAVAAIDRVLDTLARLETFQGFFFNYYDTTSLERTSNFISFVDSAWLTTGLMVARAAFPPLVGRTSTLIDRMDYRFFYDEKLGLLSHGYFVHRRVRSRYHYGVLYTEARLGALLAVGRGEVPERVWFDMVRTFPPSCEGQSSTPVAVAEKSVRGYAVTAGHYRWEGIDYVPSWGGSMFEALMPTLVLDEARFAPQSLGRNDVAHATIQRRWALETLDYPVWGLSPSAVPPGDRYREFGVRILGSRGYGAGMVTPHATALALAFDPSPAIANLRRLAARYDLYGDYGFYDAVDPKTGAVAPVYLTLDQAMTLIALANHLRPHVIQHHFAADPVVQRAIAVIGDERFFE